jgi:hypothetical protein
MTRRLGLGLVATALLLAVAVLLVLPARWAWAWALGSDPRLQAQSVSGVWWRGTAHGVRIGRTALGELHWRLRAGDWLRGRRGIRLTLAGPGIELQTHAERRRDGLRLEHLEGRLAAAWLAPALDIPLLRPTGSLRIEVRELELAPDGVPRAIDGGLDWLEAGVDGLVRAELGSVQLRAQGRDGTIDALVLSGPGSAVRIEGHVALRQDRYRAEIRLTASDLSAPIARALEFVGQPRPDGGRLLSIEGRIIRP